MEEGLEAIIKKHIKRVKSGFTKTIDLYHLKLEEFPSSILELDNLEELNISKCSIGEIPEEIGRMKSLKILNLRNNNLSCLPDALGELNNLRSLNISNNNLTSLPKNFGRLNSLKILYLKNNQLSDLPKSFELLQSLETLYLERNQFSEFPSEIYELNALKYLYFIAKDESYFLNSTYIHNRIKRLSSKICQLDKLEVLLVNSGIFIHPPPEIISRGPSDIQKFFLQIEAEGEDTLREAKLLIVGEPGAGKTTLARKIVDINSKLPDDNDTTWGIDISRFKFKIRDGNDFTLNIWDFGGQEIYHSTHQFFLTKRSLYLLISDTRKEDTPFHYWLQVIELLSESSPVLIVNNEKQDRSRDINLPVLRERFLNLREDVLKSNFKTKRGLSKLIDTIKYHAENLPHVGDTLPKTWVRVRKSLEEKAISTNYITDEEYYSICDFNGIDDYDKCLQLSNYLHDLGVFLHFKDGSVLERTIILNNVWATDGVYNVLDDKIIKTVNQGRGTKEEIFNVWSDDKYHKKKQELLALMLKFELCYRMENSSSYIFPQLLPINQPKYTWDYDKSLKFIYSYNFMPKGIMSKIIVRMHKFIEAHDLVWRSGVVIKSQLDQSALIKKSFDNKEVRIFVRGREARYFLIVIMDLIDSINHSYNNLKIEKLVQCNCEECRESSKPDYHNYTDLITRIKKSQSTIECKNSYKAVNVNGLLDSIAELDSRRKEKLLKQYSRKKGYLKRTNSSFDRKYKIFVAYSKYDLDYLKIFEDHLVTLKEESVSTFNCGEIELGEEWDISIKNELRECDILICLVSSKFLNTEYILNIEIPLAIEENKKIVPIILKPCDWENSVLGKYQAAQKGNVVSLNNDCLLNGEIKSKTSEEMDAFWTNIIKEMRAKLFEH
jgi:GTPase SAR1 family protein